MKKYYKRTVEKHKPKLNKKVFLSTLVFLFFALIRLVIIPYGEKELTLPEDKTSYSGVLDFWDVASVTVKGSKYSFQQTICSEFAQKYFSFKINFTALSSRSPEESITLNFKNGHLPDVMRTKIGSYAFDSALAIKDEMFCENMIKNYEPYIARSCDYDRVIIDLYSNASVILYNTQALDSLGISVEKSYTRDEFLKLLSKIEMLNVSSKFNIIDFPKENVFSYLPFALCPDKNFDVDYIKKVSAYLPLEHSLRSESESLNDFYLGKTLIYCGDLSDVNYLIRKREQGKLFDWAFTLYPCDKGEVVFIKEITSYAFLESKDEDKNAILKEFAEYMVSDNSLKYTENLGMINCTSTVLEYETYPHLKIFKDKNKTFYTYRDSDIKKLCSDISNMFK